LAILGTIGDVSVFDDNLAGMMDLNDANQLYSKNILINSEGVTPN